MGFRIRGKGNSGFTLIEMLITATLLTILLAVGFVEVVRTARFLKITELDNMAREIYLAAENRAALLSAGGRLEETVLAAAEKETAAGGGPIQPVMLLTDITAQTADTSPRRLRYIKYPGVAAAGLGELLHTGIIDQELLKGSFCIVYEVHSGCVTDVFYAESDEKFDAAVKDYFDGIPDNFKDFYSSWKDTGADTSRARRVERWKKAEIGYYGGEASRAPLILPAPEIEIINGEELELKVTYDDPSGDGRKLKVELTYDGSTVVLPDPDVSLSDPDGKKVCTWRLDTLRPYGKHFKDWFLGTPAALSAFGENFTVDAILEKPGAAARPAVPKSENSLFASGSSGEIAYIKYLRHLQNLDTDLFGAQNKTTAYQIADIDAGKLLDNQGNELLADYKFVPVSHYVPSGDNKLKRYISCFRPGSVSTSFYIKNLKVTASSAGWRYGGLFHDMTGGSLQNVRLLSADITVDGTAGGLIGNGGGVSFENCTVGITADASELGASDLAGVKVSGKGMVGGLLGNTWETVTVKRCEVGNLTVTSDENTAGGLVGWGAYFRFSKCKVGASGEVTVRAKAQAGGLAGMMWGWEPTGAYECKECSAENLKVVTSGIAGGLMGAVAQISASNCRVGKAGETGKVAVSGTTNVGGLVGQAGNSSSFVVCDAENLTVTSNENAGGLVGGAAGISSFSDCTVVKGSVTGKVRAGGLAGYTANNNLPDIATFAECKVKRFTVSAGYTDAVGNSGGTGGGLAGEAVNHKFVNCMVEEISVTSEIYAGGLAGMANNANDTSGTDGTFQDCTAKNIEVKAMSTAGGLVGGAANHTFSKCTAIREIAEVEESAVVTGGGETAEKIDVDGAYYAGGLVGRATVNESITFQDSGIEGLTVKAGGIVGGLLGELEGSSIEKKVIFTNCTAFDARVSDIYNTAGGLLGAAPNADFSNCSVSKDEKTGITVSGYIYAGGLAGNITNSANFKDCTIFIARVTGKDLVTGCVGGLLGSALTANFQNCTVKKAGTVAEAGESTVSGQIAAGGLAGAVGKVEAGVLSGGGEFNGCSVDNLTVAAGAEYEGTDGAGNPIRVKAGSAGGLVGSAVNTAFKGCTAGESGKIIVTGHTRAGGLAGYALGRATFDKCSVVMALVASTETSDGSAGGLIGGTDYITLTDCSIGKNVNTGNDGKIEIIGKNYAGGVAGFVGPLSEAAEKSAIGRCEVENLTVTAQPEVPIGTVGGLVGSAKRTSFSQCIIGKDSTVTVTGTVAAGGLAGVIIGKPASTSDEQIETQVETCRIIHAVVEIKSDNSVEDTGIAGGLVGSAKNTGFSDCMVGKDEQISGQINVIGKAVAGGLVGFVEVENKGSGVLSGCKGDNLTVTAGYEYRDADGKMVVAGSAGGLAGGVNNISFSDCKVGESGGIKVEGEASAGGLVGGATDVRQFTGCAVGYQEGQAWNILVLGKNFAGGLVGYVAQKSSTSGTLFETCSVFNATVKNKAGERESEAGGLVGSAVSVGFSECQVFWTAQPDLSEYQVDGGVAGGLAGVMRKGGVIDRSFAAVLVRGIGVAGGLVGVISEGNILVTTSYADCFLAGTSLGGLVGESASTLTLKNSYAAGSIEAQDDSISAGLCIGREGITIRVENVYSAVLYNGTGKVWPLISPLENGTGTNCFYLDAGVSWTSENIGEGKTCANMISPTFAAIMNGSGTDGAFEESESYFPALKALPQYRNWKTHSVMPIVSDLDASVSDSDALVSDSDASVSGSDVSGLEGAGAPAPASSGSVPSVLPAP